MATMPWLQLRINVLCNWCQLPLNLANGAVVQALRQTVRLHNTHIWPGDSRSNATMPTGTVFLRQLYLLSFMDDSCPSDSRHFQQARHRWLSPALPSHLTYTQV